MLRSFQSVPSALASFTRLGLVALAAATTLPVLANTIVEFRTPIGAFDVSLYDSAAPATVANFMAYVNNHLYDGSIVHRSVPGFVIQGGGYYGDFSGVPSYAPVVNESGLSNLRGTLAMARYVSDLNSATSQWYINTVDNVFLDAGQWTVFGVVLGNGMQVVDAIAALPVYGYSTLNPAFTDLPLRNFTGTPGALPGLQNLVTMTISAVPEAGTEALFAAGLLMLGARLRWRRVAQSHGLHARLQPSIGSTAGQAAMRP